MKKKLLAVTLLVTLITLLYYNSYYHKKSVLTKTRWLAGDLEGNPINLHGDFVLFDEYSTRNDTSNYVFNSDMQVRQAGKIIGKITSLSSSECTVTYTNGQSKITFIAFQPR